MVEERRFTDMNRLSQKDAGSRATVQSMLRERAYVDVKKRRAAE